MLREIVVNDSIAAFSVITYFLTGITLLFGVMYAFIKYVVKMDMRDF